MTLLSKKIKTHRMGLKKNKGILIMNFIKNHWIRLSYSLISVTIAIIANHYLDDTVSHPDKLNMFSYIGTVATIIALIIAIFEIAQNIHVSKSIQAEAKKYLTRATAFDHASYTNECIAMLDETNSYITHENYAIAAKCFQHFRRNFARFTNSFDNSADLVERIGKIELSLQSATQTSGAAPLAKNTRSALQKDIIEIKNVLEEKNSSRKDNYVSTED